jgi:hypothetical protein
MQRQGHSEHAVRQIEYWYKHYIDSFVDEARTTPRSVDTGNVAGGTQVVDRHKRPVSQDLLAEAHETTWRHAVVKAQAQSQPADWAAITVSEESQAYLDLLAWSSAKYRVPTDAVLTLLPEHGYRHHPR